MVKDRDNRRHTIRRKRNRDCSKDMEVAVSIADATYLKDFKEGDVLEISLNLDMISKLEALEGELSPEEQTMIEVIKNEIYKKQNQ